MPCTLQGEWQILLMLSMANLQSAPVSYKSKFKEILPIPSGIPIQPLDNQEPKNFYRFKKRTANPTYREGISYTALRSCLLHNKSDTIQWEIRRNPKWITTLEKQVYSAITGEILDESDYITDDLTAGNSRKIRAVNAFTDTFKAAYRSRSVSMLFYTLTLANQANHSVSELVNILKKRITRNGYQFYGYLWVLEISDNNHIHYHLIVTTSRMRFKGESLPDFLKVDDYWGARTQVEFVSKGLKYYLAKYFYKNKSRITGKRLFGKTITEMAKEKFGK